MNEVITITRHSPPNEMDQLPLNTRCIVTIIDGKEEIYIQRSQNDQEPKWIKED